MQQEMQRQSSGGASARRVLLLAVTVAQLFMLAGSATAGEGERLVRRDIERFIRSRIESSEGQGRKTSIDVPPLTAFFVDQKRFPGKLRTEISTRAPEPLRGRAPLAVALYAGDLLVKRSVVTPYIRRSESVLVPLRDLRVGTILAPGDFVVVERDAARLQRDVVRDVSEVVGLRTKRSLRKDRTFRSSQVESVPIVERGDRVQIVLQSGSLVINSIGKAKEAGAYGDLIRVVNTDSRREISGRVDQEGRVHVAF